MTVVGMNRDWRRKVVACAHCNAPLSRRLYHPKTGQPITAFYCNHTCKGLAQKLVNAPDREWLRSLYEDQNMDCAQIASLVSRDPKTVWTWLKGFDIQTRMRGSNTRVHIKPGECLRPAGWKHTEKTKAELRAIRLKDGHFPKDNGRPYWTGKVGVAHPAWKGGATPERQALYSSPEWAAARKFTYTRAGGKCERCHCGPAVRKLHIHHVIPFVARASRRAVSNLRVLCTDCHKFVHSAANVDREFLPWFGVLRLRQDGLEIEIPINYRPKVKVQLPAWLTERNAPRLFDAA